MKIKSLALVLALALIAGMAAPVMANGHGVSTNPFADVPADHWAYDSVTKLAAVGLVEGYPDGTFGGTRMMTRYEAAMVFARLLARMEVLIGEEVAKETAGVQAAITADLMAEIEAAKAELEELIRWELANLEIPVVEVEPVEHIVERQPIERPFQMTPEAEAVISQLVSELASEYLAEARELAGRTVVETTIVERIVEAEDALTSEDVRRIAEELLIVHLAEHEALITQALRENQEQFQKIEALEGDLAYVEYRVLGLIEGIRGDMEAMEAAFAAEIDNLAADMLAMGEEFEAELNLFGIRVDGLADALGILTDRVDALEAGQEALAAEQAAQAEAHAALRDDHEELKTEVHRVKISGNLEFAGEYVLGEEGIADTIKGSAALTVQAASGTSAKIWTDLVYTGDPYTRYQPTKFGVQIDSDTPIYQVVAGAWSAAAVRGYMTSYVMNPIDAYGIVARANIGPVKADVALSPNRVGAALNWQFVEAVGIQASFANDHSTDTSAMMAGLKGDIAMLGYDVKFAMDNYEDEAVDNWLVDAKVSADIFGLAPSFRYVLRAENFGEGNLTSVPFVDGTALSLWEAGASASLFGVSLGGTVYGEMAEEALFMAYQATASTKFDFFIPLSLSGRVSGNMPADEAVDPEMSLQGKVGIDGMPLFGGLTFNAGYTYDQNAIQARGNFRNIAHYTGNNTHTVEAGLGYGFNWSGADVTLGYDYKLVIPFGEDVVDPSETTHSVSAKYAYSSTLALNLSAERFNLAPDEGEEVDAETTIKAGLTLSW